MAEKKTRGRQKIEMKKIENEDDRLITFSKRRSGIYKKASELVTLTGAEIGIVVFSPSGKPFSFGHPSIETILNRILKSNDHPPPVDNTLPLVEAHRQLRIGELSRLHNEMVRQLDEEKEKGKALMEIAKGKETAPRWWEVPIEDMNLQQLLQMNGTYDDLHRSLLAKLEEKTAAEGASSSMPLPPPTSPDEAAANPSPPARAYPFSHGFWPGKF